MALLGAKHARGDGGVELVFPHRADVTLDEVR
jgi:hypothetical protein